jgi:hypothetical protein
MGFNSKILIEKKGHINIMIIIYKSELLYA